MSARRGLYGVQAGAVRVTRPCRDCWPARRLRRQIATLTQTWAPPSRDAECGGESEALTKAIVRNRAAASRRPLRGRSARWRSIR